MMQSMTHTEALDAPDGLEPRTRCAGHLAEIGLDYHSGLTWHLSRCEACGALVSTVAGTGPHRLNYELPAAAVLPGART